MPDPKRLPPARLFALLADCRPWRGPATAQATPEPLGGSPQPPGLSPPFRLTQRCARSHRWPAAAAQAVGGPRPPAPAAGLR